MKGILGRIAALHRRHERPRARPRRVPPSCRFQEEMPLKPAIILAGLACRDNDELDRREELAERRSEDPLVEDQARLALLRFVYRRRFERLKSTRLLDRDCDSGLVDAAVWQAARDLARIRAGTFLGWPKYYREHQREICFPIAEPVPDSEEDVQVWADQLGRCSFWHRGAQFLLPRPSLLLLSGARAHVHFSMPDIEFRAILVEHLCAKTDELDEWETILSPHLVRFIKDRAYTTGMQGELL